MNFLDFYCAKELTMSVGLWVRGERVSESIGSREEEDGRGM